MRTIEIDKGMQFTNAVERAVDLATASGESVKFLFNDNEYTAHPGMPADLLHSQFQRYAAKKALPEVRSPIEILDALKSVWDDPSGPIGTVARCVLEWVLKMDTEHANAFQAGLDRKSRHRASTNN